jgi:signal transduction histidine kinase
VSQIVSTAIEAMAAPIAEVEIQVETCIAPGTPQILADPELALRCLTNLIENAVKYAAEGR